MIAYTTESRLDKYEDRKFSAYFYRSGDDGRTWGNPVRVAEANETTALHVGNGRWLAVARPRNSRRIAICPARREYDQIAVRGQAGGVVHADRIGLVLR